MYIKKTRATLVFLFANVILLFFAKLHYVLSIVFLFMFREYAALLCKYFIYIVFYLVVQVIELLLFLNRLAQ